MNDLHGQKRSKSYTEKERNMVYKPSFEQGNCGVGFIARIDGRPCHSIIEDAVRILVNLEHRGPVGYDTSDGDGAGLMIRIPDGISAPCVL